MPEETNSIIDIIKEYTDIIEYDNKVVGKCPIHHGKGNSLYIDKSSNTFDCISCGASGSIKTFLSNIDNVKEEHKHIIDNYNQEPEHDLESGYKALNWAADTYHKILIKYIKHGDNEVLEYVKSRKLTKEIIIKYKIGYAPKKAILKGAVSDGVNPSLFIATGLMVDGQYGPYDKFTDRLMLPIFDIEDRVVGFTGRTLPSNTNPKRPKYLNSPTTWWFDKTNLWYGLGFNKDNISDNNSAILVEGNMDVIAASCHGLSNVIAAQGTSFNETKLVKLMPYTTNITLAFDNDEPGIVASNKLEKMAKELGFTVSKLDIPQEYKDIDEYLNSDKYNGELKIK